MAGRLQFASISKVTDFWPCCDVLKPVAFQGAKRVLPVVLKNNFEIFLNLIREGVGGGVAIIEHCTVCSYSFGFTSPENLL